MSAAFISNFRGLLGQSFTGVLTSVIGCLFSVGVMTGHAMASTEDVPAASANISILKEINIARTDPRGYAQMLRSDLLHFHGLIYEAPGHEALETQEGAAAVKEAIADLEARAPSPPLAADSDVAQAALRLVADQGHTGAEGHLDSRNARLSDRLEAAGVWANSMEEDIAYGPTDAHEAVRELIVDDGVAGREHRKAIFDGSMTRVGSASGPHADMGWMWVIDFTSETMPASRVKSKSARSSGGDLHGGPIHSGAQTASNP